MASYPTVPSVALPSPKSPGSKSLQVDESYIISQSELHYEKNDLLGRGSFGSVYKGKLHGKEVAVKLFHDQNLGDDVLGDLVNETKILSKLHHPNVLLLIGVCVEPGNIAIVTELMSGGSLHTILHGREVKPPLERRLRFAVDACLGLAYLHRESNTVLHRDLKPLNLLVDCNGTLKVADFGISQMKISIGENETDLDGYYASSNAWVAPEVFGGSPYTDKSDVFSFGVILWEILTCEVPWEGMNSLVVLTQVFKKSHRPELPATCSPILRSLIERCWSQDPQDRPKMKEILPELKASVVEATVSDVEGQQFWIKSFDQYRSPFPDFLACLQEKFGLEVDGLTTKCLMALLCDEGSNIVTKESFARLLCFFGPVDGDMRVVLHRIRTLLEEPYFHGDIEKDDAVKLLSREKKAGSFLVRFSGTRGGSSLGNYAISLKKKNGSISHIRLTGGGGRVCDNLERFIKLNKKEVGLKYPCPGSRYRHIFDESVEPNSSAMSGYGYMDPVDMSALTLKVEKRK